MKIHELKCHFEAFEAKALNLKNWEYRLNDRNYKIGDILIEKEYFPEQDKFTGREIEEQVIWMLKGGSFGIPAGYVIMTTKELSRKQ